MAEFAAHGANQEEKMAAEKAKKTIVIGHKNPDTDSICSAIGYANFKTLQTGGEYVPCRAGELNPESKRRSRILRSARRQVFPRIFP